MGIVNWMRNTFYTALFCGAMGAIATSQSNGVFDAYERGLKTEAELLQKYERKHSNLEKDLEEAEINHQKFSEGSNLYKTKEVAIHPVSSYKKFKDYGRFDFSEVFTKKSLNGLKYGALAGLGLRLFLGLKRKKKKKQKN